MTKITTSIVLSLLLISQPLYAQDSIKESKNRAKRAALHDATQLVRGDSGKWNDHALLQHAPPIELKPSTMSLNVWADQLLNKKVELTDKDNNWLFFRTEQLDDNDRVWVERIERRGQQITVVANQAKWQGKYFRNFTDYRVIGLNLGKLDPGKYEVMWITQPLVFTKFDGDGKALDNNWPQDERPAGKKPTELRLSITVSNNPQPGDKAADDPAKPFFAKHCQTCHEGKKLKGNFRLDSLALDFNDKANRERWLAVLEQVKSGIMPPKEKPRPSAQEVQALSDWISAHVEKGAAASNASQGRVVLRRLNRAEYENTVRDLLDVDLDLKDVLAPEALTEGFDNRAEGLRVSSFLMEQYLEAADTVLDAAIASGRRPTTVKRRFDIREEKSVNPKGSVYRHVDDGVAIFSSWVSANIQVTLWNFRSRDPGNYRFRISGYGYQSTKPVTFHVMAGTLTEATQQHLVGYYEVPPAKPTVVEFIKRLETKNTIRIVVDGLGVIPPVVQKVGAENYKGPGLNVQWVEIEGPLYDSWPPPSHRRIFRDMLQAPAPTPDDKYRLEVVSKAPLADAERILRDFMRRAFRRAVTDDDVKPFLARVKTKLDAKASFEQAMRVGLKSVLVSPHFLYLREKPGKLDDSALASRLSYFLWSSMPDEELLTLAELGKLNEPGMLRKQVERMLRDPKATAFTENFVGQWLNLRAIDATVPDPTLYPEYDEVLKLAMVKEAYLFFDEVLKNDLSLTNFVASDFSMLNERLAKHYGIPGRTGMEFRKVSLPPNSHRGGVLTMAGVLKVTANGTTTSPILRGSWVLERILGTPPPRPTVDVEAVEPDIRGATTIREQLTKHRQLASCATCHVKIDPPGFALENFDVIGGWRENYRSVGKGDTVVLDGRTMRYKKGLPVDAADVLPDGRKFKNIDEYKQLLLTDKDQLARALAEKLVSYATGGTPAKSDQPGIDAIVGRIRAKDYGLRTLVHEIVQSTVFQSK